jgi:hypothetical protein
LNKNSQITTNYAVNAIQPTPEQLAPVQDNTNPLYIRKGNPFLKTAVTHQLGTQIAYYTSDFKWHANLFGLGTITSNQIVDDSYFDTSGRQETTFRNVNGSYQFNIHLGIGTTIRLNEWYLSFQLMPGINLANNIGFVNKEKNTSKAIQFNPQVTAGINYSNKLSIMLNGSMNANNTVYSLNGIEDIEYNVKNIMLFTKWSPVKRINLITSLVHTYNSQLPKEFQRARTMLNSSVTYNFLKTERLIVGISVNDILNQNVNVTRSVTPAAIETTQTSALKRYGMLTINYRLSSFGQGFTGIF